MMASGDSSRLGIPFSSIPTQHNNHFPSAFPPSPLPLPSLQTQQQQQQQHRRTVSPQQASNSSHFSHQYTTHIPSQQQQPQQQVAAPPPTQQHNYYPSLYDTMALSGTSPSMASASASTDGNIPSNSMPNYVPPPQPPSQTSPTASLSPNQRSQSLGQQRVVAAHNWSPENFELIMRQQPKHSRMCGYGDKVDRRPIDPPPILQLKIKGHCDPQTFLHNPYYFMYATLCTGDTRQQLHMLRDGKTKTTIGSVVSSFYRLKDIDNTDGGFFVFPDLSVRTEGTYRLMFGLFEIAGNQLFHCASVYSDVFQVYSPKRFPGMEESTSLSRSFAEQGLKIRVRKELRLRRSAKKQMTYNMTSANGASPTQSGAGSADSVSNGEPSRYQQQQQQYELVDAASSYSNPTSLESNATSPLSYRTPLFPLTARPDIMPYSNANNTTIRNSPGSQLDGAENLGETGGLKPKVCGQNHLNGNNFLSNYHHASSSLQHADTVLKRSFDGVAGDNSDEPGAKRHVPYLTNQYMMSATAASPFATQQHPMAASNDSIGDGSVPARPTISYLLNDNNGGGNSVTNNSNNGMLSYKSGNTANNLVQQDNSPQQYSRSPHSHLGQSSPLHQKPIRLFDPQALSNASLNDDIDDSDGASNNKSNFVRLFNQNNANGDVSSSMVDISSAEVA